jgi:cytochrome c-type biogenesis protein CcmH/NrfG
MSEDINQEILAEIRKSRRSTQILLAVIGGVLLLVSFTHQKPAEPAHSWSAVQTDIRQLDFPKALALAQANVAIQSSDYHGHSYLGFIYLSMGDVTNPEAEYLRAYQLVPSEDNEKSLAAVRKRLAAGGDFKLLSK